jgi:hypothetical protein
LWSGAFAVVLAHGLVGIAFSHGRR